MVEIVLKDANVGGVVAICSVQEVGMIVLAKRQGKGERTDTGDKGRD